MSGCASDVIKGGLCVATFGNYSNGCQTTALIHTKVTKLIYVTWGTGEVVKCCLYGEKSSDIDFTYNFVISVIFMHFSDIHLSETLNIYKHVITVVSSPLI